MNNYIISEIDQAQKKMSSYVALLNYRYMNLCVKAEAVSLLPVTVIVGGSESNLEEVASVDQPNDYQLRVFPNNSDAMQPIIHGIYEAHPEFKMTIGSLDGTSNPDTQFMTYTMPEVDKERHDLLTEAVKGLYDECKARIDVIFADYHKIFIELLEEASPENLKETEKALEKPRNQYYEFAEDLLNKKIMEIDEGYEKYLKEQEEKQNIITEDNCSTRFKMY